MRLSLNSFFHSISSALQCCRFDDVFLKVKQYKILDAILSGKDVIGVLPTGYGKSMIFQLLPYVYEYHSKKQSIVLVIAPLNAIIDDQIQSLRKRGVSAGILKTKHANSNSKDKPGRGIEKLCAEENESDSDIGNSDNDIYYKWHKEFREILETSIPNRTVTIRPRDKPWMNSGIRKEIRKRNRLLKYYCSHKSPEAWENYRVQRNLTTSHIRAAKETFYVKLNEKLQNPEIVPKKWWGLIKLHYGNKIHSNIPALVDGDRVITDSKEKATLFNDYFCSVYEIENADTALPTLDVFQDVKFIDNISTSTQEINILLKNVDVSKACGYDGIGNKILKICADYITNPLCHIINESLSQGVFPSMWKFANVIPIFKKNDRQDKLNYRPVSLLTCLSKICEKIVFIRLYNFLLEIKFLTPFQSGFRPGDSTTNQLILITHKIFEALERGKEVRMVFLDISKAFDKVWHRGLLLKLERLGVQDPLLKWFRSYLTGRKQRVIIDGQSSDWKQIEAGVPQGSVLGPLLFLFILMTLLQIFNLILFFMPTILPYLK